jgi:hypothetical protein
MRGGESLEIGAVAGLQQVGGEVVHPDGENGADGGLKAGCSPGVIMFVFAGVEVVTVSSPEANASCLLSLEKAADVTEPVWPSSVCSGFLVVATQSRTVLSSEADASCLPLLEKATDMTQSVWPSSVVAARPSWRPRADRASVA